MVFLICCITLVFANMLIFNIVSGYLLFIIVFFSLGPSSISGSHGLSTKNKSVQGVAQRYDNNFTDRVTVRFVKQFERNIYGKMHCYNVLS